MADDKQADRIAALTREIERLKLDLFVAASDRDALKARLAALTTAEGCDVEAAAIVLAKDGYPDASWDAWADEAKDEFRKAASAALAAGCAPLRAKYEHVVEQARIISRTGVNVHALPSLLVNLNAALAALEGDKP